MKEISFRLTVDDDDSVRGIFDKYNCYVVKENADEEENRTHYHGVVYDKGRETLRNSIKTFETSVLKGNSLYAIKNVYSNGGTLERAEQYISKGETEAVLPNVIVNTRGVDVEACHRRYWEERRRVNDSSVAVRNGKRKDDFSFKKGFKEYIANNINVDDESFGGVSRYQIASMLRTFIVENYESRKSEIPYNMKNCCETIYHYYQDLGMKRNVIQSNEHDLTCQLMKFLQWDYDYGYYDRT